ncbi:hypothetical protein GCM10007301_40040 [Azorhizobium oxalatiphilum]|uniref:Uncharacterized protein n=1 Tax=Azorhizobium oxalatiphilum TaxID=980631 RepID=A0A917C8P9_9HYPH|nr:hypothetical protein GCM10007301_40040 [Azorhizobium oxalatiphilum]
MARAAVSAPFQMGAPDSQAASAEPATAPVIAAISTEISSMRAPDAISGPPACRSRRVVAIGLLQPESLGNGTRT